MNRAVRIAWVCALVGSGPHVHAGSDADQHLGVASCATGVCHGKLTPQKDRDVWLNEYRVWSAEDRHARAYQTLLTPESKRIAAELGIASAQNSEACLKCHADNVEVTRRGPKFQISDGVGCEACHGGSERWIKSHAETTATHADNVAKGMYPTEQSIARAVLCVGCHVGAEDRFATHEIMGAGHPRLSFELDAFSTNQPAHFAVDADYVRRKGQVAAFNLWLVGQLACAERSVTLSTGHWFRGTASMYPELSFYDCHGCHHSMDDRRWSQAVAGSGIAPGSLRLQTDHLLMLLAASEALEPASARGLARAMTAYVRAGQQSNAAVKDAANVLLRWLDDHEQQWSGATFSKDQVQAVRRSLVGYAAQGKMADFAAAEQTFLALESLSLYLGDATRVRGPLDDLFATVEDDARYSPAKFAASAKRLQAAL